MPERLWTVKDVADFIGVHTKTLYVWLHEDQGPPAVRVGNRLRYRPDDVMAWLEAHRQGPQASS